MSWNKNTVMSSEVDTIVELLKEMRVDYKLSVLGSVVGMGLNDSDGFSDEPSRKYNIRRLDYGDKVVLERMVRHPDCDCDDVIVSEKFGVDGVPIDWVIEMRLEGVEGYK